MQLKDHKGSPSLSRTETDKLPLPTPTQLARQEDSEEDSGLYPQVRLRYFQALKIMYEFDKNCSQ